MSKRYDPNGWTNSTTPRYEDNAPDNHVTWASPLSMHSPSPSSSLSPSSVPSPVPSPVPSTRATPSPLPSSSPSSVAATPSSSARSARRSLVPLGHPLAINTPIIQRMLSPGYNPNETPTPILNRTAPSRTPLATTAASSRSLFNAPHPGAYRGHSIVFDDLPSTAVKRPKHRKGGRILKSRRKHRTHRKRSHAKGRRSLNHRRARTTK